jgi:hypothetical protein
VRVYKKLWEERGADEWMRIREEFGITDILVPPDWQLHLPAVAKSNAYVLYSTVNTTSQVSP